LRGFRSAKIVLLVAWIFTNPCSGTPQKFDAGGDREPGSLKYTIHDLDIPGNAYRSVQMSEDDFGRLILASGGSIWTFDGDKWSEYIERFVGDHPLSGISMGDDGTLYVGANGDWGTLELNESGDSQFVSKKDYMNPDHQRIREDLYRVDVFKDGVSYMGYTSCVYVANGGETSIHTPFYRLTTQFELGDRRFICSQKRGILDLSSGTETRFVSDKLPDRIFFTASGKWLGETVVLGSNGFGLFVFDGDSIEKLPLGSDLLEGKRINGVALLENKYVAVTIDSWGLAIFSLDGELLQSISADEDSRFIRAAELYYFDNNNLWISLGNSVARVFFPSPISVFDDRYDVFVSWPSPTRYGGDLWLRSNDTIYRGIYDGSGKFLRFEEADFPRGNIGVDALMGSKYGLFFSDETGIHLRKNDGQIETILSDCSSYFLTLHPHRSDILFSFDYAGVRLFRHINGNWEYHGDFLEAEGSNNEVLIEDREGYFWAERGAGRVLRFRFENDRLVGRLFTEKDGLDDAWISVFEYEGDCYIGNGLESHYKFDYEREKFVPSSFFQTLEQDLGFGFVRPYSLGNGDFLLPTSNGMVLARKTEPRGYRFDFDTFAAFPEYVPTVVRVEGDDVWIRSQNSLLKYRTSEPPVAQTVSKPVIQSVGIPGSTHNLYIASRDDVLEGEMLELDYQKEGVRFKFFTPSFSHLLPLRHRFKLEGFSDSWSEISNTNEAVFIGLREGSYTFLVEAVDHYGHMSDATSFQLKIHPPWYRSIPAYGVYVLAIILFTMIVAYLNRRSVVRINHELEKLVKLRTSELREAADAALDATRAKSRFLANMSHEIRTPINGIIGSSELLSNHDLIPQQKELVGIIESSASSLIGLVDGILDFSRIEANRIELRRDHFDLHKSIAECVEVLAILSRRKQVELYYSIDPDVPDFFIGDLGRIKQIIINLLGNALKFTNDGYVRLHCSAGDRNGSRFELSFLIEDTGIGIEQEEIGRLFEAFHQVDNSSTRNFGGAGLGLAICQQLVELMGGKISVESEINSGTQILFTIQLETDSDRETSDPAPRIDWLQGKRILAVDSFQDRRENTKQYLERGGAQVVSCGNASVALELIAKETYDFAYVDFREEKDYDRLCDKLESLKTEGALKHFGVFAFSELRFRDTLLPHIQKKPFTYRNLERVLNPAKPASSSQPKIRSEILERYPELAKYQKSEKALKMLIVEDNKVNHRVVELLLSSVGLRADHAWNGLEAVTMMENKTYDICFMDVQMPVMDGIESTKKIKKIHPNCFVIGLTANALEIDRKIGIEAGMDAFLTKPVRKTVLLNSVENALKTLRDQLEAKTGNA